VSNWYNYTRRKRQTEVTVATKDMSKKLENE